ncbi:MAG: hypothetical protein DRP79_05530 [Planctomycetota bacterium]|nr:MAG: hypothetical protein DRP79_05530 [Planctomycetota bacterium]
MKERDRIDVRICGTGGQGIVMAGNILAEALLRSYEFATNSASYGPEVRGTSVRSDVVCSQKWIDYPRADSPDWVIALAQKVYDAGAGDFGDDSVVLYDPALVEPSARCPARHVRIPASQACLNQFGDSANANLAMLGALSTFGVVPEKDLETAAVARLKMPEKIGGALRLGRRLAEG